MQVSQDLVYTPLKLFTITTEGMVDNVVYGKEKRFIFSILANIPDKQVVDYEWLQEGDDKTSIPVAVVRTKCGVYRVPNVDGVDNETFMETVLNTVRNPGLGKAIKAWDPSVIRVGCNYGEYLTKEYYDIRHPVKKTNRGRKRKEAPKKSKGGVGLKRYFNSQITFTTLADSSALERALDKKEHLYHIKLYSNGKLQVPNVRSENIKVVMPALEKITMYVNHFEDCKLDAVKPCGIAYIKPIMMNYKFKLDSEDVLIDINKFTQVSEQLRQYLNNGTPCSWSEQFELHRNVLEKRKLTIVKLFSERYVGSILKFEASSEEYPNRMLTAMLFYSGRVNLDGGNSREHAEEVMAIIKTIIEITRDDILYKKLV